MLRSRVFVLVLAQAIAGLVSASRPDRINPDFHNRANPFLDVLMLEKYHPSLYRDSARIALDGGGYADLILKEQKLWNLARYDKNGERMDIGTLRDGDGTVRLRFGNSIQEADFVDGRLDGRVWFCIVSWGRTDTLIEYGFKAGLLDGVTNYRSYLDLRKVSKKATYADGYLMQEEVFGRVRKWVIFFGLRPMFVHPEFLCKRTIYDKGKFVSKECFRKKCRCSAF